MIYLTALKVHEFGIAFSSNLILKDSKAYINRDLQSKISPERINSASPSNSASIFFYVT
jgi:hypothetical protein